MQGRKQYAGSSSNRIPPKRVAVSARVGRLFQGNFSRRITQAFRSRNSRVLLLFGVVIASEQDPAMPCFLPSRAAKGLRRAKGPLMLCPSGARKMVEGNSQNVPEVKVCSDESCCRW
jgi:hypothetical protein